MALTKIETRFRKRYRGGHAPCYQKLRTKQQIQQERNNIDRDLKRIRKILDRHTKQLQSGGLSAGQIKYRQEKIPKHQHDIERLEALQEDLQRQENCILGLQTEQREVKRRGIPNPQKEFSRLIPNTNIMLFGKVDGYDPRQRCIIEFKTRTKRAYHRFWPNEKDQVLTYMWLSKAHRAKLIEKYKNDSYEEDILNFPQSEWDSIQAMICKVINESFKFGANGTLQRRSPRIDMYFETEITSVPPVASDPPVAVTDEPVDTYATEASGFLYVARAGRHMFIDWTKDVPQCLAKLDAYNPEVIELQAVFPLMKDRLEPARGLFEVIRQDKPGWFLYDSTVLRKLMSCILAVPSKD